jgi:dehydrogenase/reductase SDR family protein 13
MTGRLDGRVAIVTGASTGIGLVTARELARRGARVFLAGRSAARTVPAVEEIRRETGADRAEFLPLDLSDPGSIRSAAEAFLSRGIPLHLLVNNAGLAGAGGVTREGFEMTFATNHLGPFLLTLLLLPRLRESAPSRVVNVSSHAHYRVKGMDWEALRRPATSAGAFHEYSVSKLANVLFTTELSRRLPGTGVTAYALHPGVVATDLWRRLPWGVRHVAKLFMISPEEGARTTLHCAASPEAAGESGLYYDECRPRHPSRIAQDPALAAELWRRSVEWTGAPAVT